MNIDFECQNCECNFEIEMQDLTDSPDELACPTCRIKYDPNTVENMMIALNDLITTMVKIGKKFRFSINLETDELLESVDSDEIDEDEDETTADEEDEIWGDDDEL